MVELMAFDIRPVEFCEGSERNREVSLSFSYSTLKQVTTFSEVHHDERTHLYKAESNVFNSEDIETWQQI